MKTQRLLWIAGMVMVLVHALASPARAHQCSHFLDGHCKCEARRGGQTLSSVENHQQCYRVNQQNGANSACANWCEGQWDAGGAFRTAAQAASGNNTNCAFRITVRFKAGNEPYFPTDRVDMPAPLPPTPPPCSQGRTLRNGMCVCS